MKNYIKISLLLLLLALMGAPLFVKAKPQMQPTEKVEKKRLDYESKIDDLYKKINQLSQDNFDIKQEVKTIKDSSTNQNQLLENNKQIVQLSQNIADTKQAFYDSAISTASNAINIWGFVFIVIFGIAGFFGYKNVSSFENKTTKHIDKKLIEFNEKIEVALTNSKTEIDKGLNHNYERTIKEIFDKNFSKDLEDLKGELAEYQNTVGKLNAKVQNLRLYSRKKSTDIKSSESKNSSLDEVKAEIKIIKSNKNKDPLDE